MLTVAQRAARGVSCLFEIVFIVLSILHDAIPLVDRSRDFLLSEAERAILRAQHQPTDPQRVESDIAQDVPRQGSKPDPVGTPYEGPEQLIGAGGKRIVLVDYENSSQGVAEVLLNRRGELSRDVLCCFVSQQKPPFMLSAVMGNCMWVGTANGVKEAADHVIVAMVASMALKETSVYIIHGGDHRWYDVSKKYGVEHHVVQGGKKHAVEEYTMVKNMWKL
jgi:hypothetical protein